MGKKLRELHMRHHFQDHDRGFGVSAPYWDHVFGTAPRRRRTRAVLAVRHAGPAVTREPDPPIDRRDPEEAEVVDGLPVLAADVDQAPPPTRRARRRRSSCRRTGCPPWSPCPPARWRRWPPRGSSPGAATVAMVHRRRSRALTRRARRRKAAARTPLGEVVSSTSFLVDVHLLRRD